MSVGRLVDDAVNASIVLAGRVLVGFGCWRSERRRDFVAGRAQRVLDAERLAEDEAERDYWEPGQLGEECWACGCPSSRHYGNAGLHTPCSDCSCVDLLIQRPVHPADAKHHGGHRLNLDGTVTPLTSYARHPSAGGAVGPEAVSGQPPASGQPTATQLLDHIEAAMDAHRIDIYQSCRSARTYCSADGCGWNGHGIVEHKRHVAEVIAAMVAADVPVGDALKGTR